MFIVAGCFSVLVEVEWKTYVLCVYFNEKETHFNLPFFCLIPRDGILGGIERQKCVWDDDNML